MSNKLPKWISLSDESLLFEKTLPEKQEETAEFIRLLREFKTKEQAKSFIKATIGIHIAKNNLRTNYFPVNLDKVVDPEENLYLGTDVHESLASHKPVENKYFVESSGDEKAN